MGTFVELDMSLKETSICILDQDGARVFEGKVASEPIATCDVRSTLAHPDWLQLCQIGLEKSGPAPPHRLEP